MMEKTKLFPGLRFHPTDVELVKYYLKRKILGKKLIFEAISVVDIYKFPPWDLPDKSLLQSKDRKWYFFCPRERKYASGARMNRATESGYWKTTGKDRPVNSNDELVGMIKTLVFHIGRAPNGDRTDWVMHEYRLEEKGLADRGVIQDSYVLCRIFQKDGPGPRNGAQYGAPFMEEDWTDDEKDNCLEVDPSATSSGPNFLLPSRDHAASSSRTPESFGFGPPESCVSVMVASSREVLQPISSNDVSHHNDSVASASLAHESIGFGSSPLSCVVDTVPSSCNVPSLSTKDVPVEKLPVNNDVEFLELSDLLGEEDLSNVNENGKNKETNNPNPNNAAADGAAACPDGNDIFKDLGDLSNWNVGGFTSSTLDEMFSGDDNQSFLEIMDLDAPLNNPPGSADEHEYNIQFDGSSAGFNCYPNFGQSSCQVNAVPAVQSSPWVGELEEYRFGSDAAAAAAAHNLSAQK